MRPRGRWPALVEDSCRAALMPRCGRGAHRDRASSGPQPPTGAAARCPARLPGPLRRRAGRAPAVARAASGRGRARRAALAARGLRGAVLSLTRPAQPRARRARGRAWRPASRSLPTTSGATTCCGGSTAWSARGAADRADDAHLARLVRDQQRGRQLAAADDQPEPHPAAAVPRDLPADARGDDRRPGDAAVAVAVGLDQGRAQRELRARDAGALHARRRRRLHRGGRAPARARADRLDQQLERGDRRARRLPLRPQAPRRRRQGRSTTTAAASAGATACASCSRTPTTPRYFVTKLWSYFSPEPLPKADARAAAAALYTVVGQADPPAGGGMPDAPADLRRARAWSSRRSCRSPGCCAAIGRYVDTDAWAWESSQAGQMPFYPPNVSGWDATRWLNTDTWVARFNLTNQMIKPRARAQPGEGARSGRTRKAMTREAIAFWGAPDASARATAGRAARLRAARRSARPRPTGSASSTPP